MTWLQTYAALRSAGGTVFTLSSKASELRIYAFRAGKAAKFGHNHVLSASAFQGFFQLSPEGTAASRFDLVFRLDQLVFDVPEHRAALGPAFASTISEEDRASTRSNMLGDNASPGGTLPLLRIQSLQIVGDAPKFAAPDRGRAARPVARDVGAADRHRPTRATDSAGRTGAAPV